MIQERCSRMESKLQWLNEHIDDPLARIEILKDWLIELEGRLRVAEQWIHDRQYN